MTTLAAMVSSIVAETGRNDADWETRVRGEITKAIRFYQRERFFFNESRTITFNTVAGQEFYGAADNANIPNLLAIDYLTITQNTNVYELAQATPHEQDVYDTNLAQGIPVEYSYFQQQLRLWPIPDKAYPVRVNSVIRAPAPATDVETDNPWMVDAEELIRSRAKRNLYLHSMSDQQEAAAMKGAEDEALSSLRAETSRRTAIHSFLPAEVY